LAGFVHIAWARHFQDGEDSVSSNEVGRIIFGLPGNEEFASKVANQGGWEYGELETRRFPDGESYVRLQSDVSHKEVILVCTLSRPDSQFLTLIFTADAARELGAASVTLVAPYLSYMRQDRRFNAGEAVTSKTFAAQISSAFNRLITVDPHLHRYPNLSAIYSCETIVLHAAPLIGDWLAAEVPHPLVIGPDEESVQWVAAVAAKARAPHVVLRKTRFGDRRVELIVPDLSRWQHRKPVLVDDIASSGRTLIEASKAIQAQGLARPICAVVHPLFAEESFAELKSAMDNVASTDAVPHISNRISLVPLVAGALQCHR